MNKLTVLRTDTDERGVKVHRVLYWYIIPTGNPIVDFNGVKVIPQKQTELPAEALALTGASAIPTADKNEVDLGNAGFEGWFRQQTNGETNAQLATRLLADHAACEAAWLAAKRAQFALAGRGVS